MSSVYQQAFRPHIEDISCARGDQNGLLPHDKENKIKTDLENRSARRRMQWNFLSKTNQKGNAYRRGTLSPLYPISPVATVAYIRSQLGSRGNGTTDKQELSRQQVYNEAKCTKPKDISSKTHSFDINQKYSDIGNASFVKEERRYGQQTSPKLNMTQKQSSSHARMDRHCHTRGGKSCFPVNNYLCIPYGVGVNSPRKVHSKLTSTEKKLLQDANQPGQGERDVSHVLHTEHRVQEYLNGNSNSMVRNNDHNTPMLAENGVSTFGVSRFMKCHEENKELPKDIFNKANKTIPQAWCNQIHPPWEDFRGLADSPSYQLHIGSDKDNQHTFGSTRTAFVMSQDVSLPQHTTNMTTKRSGMHQVQLHKESNYHNDVLEYSHFNNRQSKIVHHELARQQTYGVDCLQSENDMTQLKTKASLASLHSVELRTSPHNSFVTSTPYENPKKSKASSVSKKASEPLSSDPGLSSKTQSEPRHAVTSSFCRDYDFERDNRARISKIPPKSAPNHHIPVTDNKVRHGLKPVNLFPEWTQGRQTDKSNAEKTGCPQGIDNAAFQDGVITNGVIHNPCQQRRTAVSTDNHPAYNRDKQISVPKKSFVSSSYDHPNKIPQDMHSSTFGVTRDPLTAERKGQYWFNDNTIRRLSALDPKVFTGKGMPDGRISWAGVKQAKSVDIASIYSSKPFKNINFKFPNSSGDNNRLKFSQDIDISKGQILNRSSNGMTLSQDNQAFPPKTAKGQNMESAIYSRTQSPPTKIKCSVISIEDHGIPDEEFRPAELVLQDLHYSPQEQTRFPNSQFEEAYHAPSTKHNSMRRMSVPEKITVQSKTENRQSLNATTKINYPSNRESQRRMTQENIRVAQQGLHL
ncbi:hypothetical protein EGW08_013967 [Elysia chlorotica]|uniref:Uncharacterized protein n=1 Tax=Elysia chlorotica TaxID=188477 RepID=A0A433T9Q1_ELYCH|nr:hypothetical protein EGW08_013967 [Elysia chlorotica]